MNEQPGLFVTLPRSTSYMEMQGHRIDAEIRALMRLELNPDPVMGADQARIASLGASIQRRHGRLLEHFVRDAVATNPDNQVWREPRFQVSTAANDLAVSDADTATVLATRLPYQPGPDTLEIDMLVYNRRARSLRAYEIKRANGPHDNRRTRQIVSDSRRVQFLLGSYGEGRGLDSATAESWLICFYGVRVRGALLQIDRLELDNHLGFPVLAMIEEANALWRQRIEELARLEA